MSLDKYIHSDVEDKIYTYWEKNNLFKPKKNKKKFSIVIPPPNVTGSLHMGHALNNSIQDLLTRYYRMNNYETLWQPGTDHAGIATQALVEKKLNSENIKKNDLGREKFIKKVWEWKNQYGEEILGWGQGDQDRYFKSQSGLERGSDEYKDRFSKKSNYGNTRTTGQDYAWYN